MNKPVPFNPNTVDLVSRNLIEASAGTGKTYSVAVLVLRLIIEKNIPVERILMVTFTNAAVAELELRIRKFIRHGLRYCKGKEIPESEKDITEIIDKTGKEAALEKLSRAVQSLDELSVFTIHAFCQKTISEFTFETGQSFEHEILKDDSPLFEHVVNKYIREQLNTLKNYDLFKEVWKGIRQDEMSRLLRKNMEGMQLLGYDIDEGITIDVLTQNFENRKLELKKFVEHEKSHIIATPSARNNLRVFALNNDTDGFIKKYLEILKQKEERRPDYFAHFQFMHNEFVERHSEIIKAINDVVRFCYNDFFKQAKEGIRGVKDNYGYIAFDDQIKTIHEALGSDTFKSGLQEKYDAIFIDEFQDTDKLQYEIFSGVFSEKKIMFFIGDPKQSIYGWRKADLDTFNNAKTAAGESVFTMKKNFRSTQKLIDALEKLFDPTDGYNVFEDEKIRFEKVDAGSDKLGIMTDDMKEVIPVSITEFDINDFRTNIDFTAQEVYRLLSGNTAIKGEKIKPSDIGILVREGKEGDRIKAALARFNIPSVKRDDLKVLESDEAKQIQYLLKAVINPRSGDINRALFSKFFGFSLEKVQKLDDEKNLEIFLELKRILKDDGVYNMISGFLDQYAVRQLCKDDVLGQRVLTNITQISEILHKTEKRYRYAPEELLVWMQRSSANDDDEFEQRIESDEDAVQISTIHKCKGLSYNIVFAPFLSMIPKFKLLEKGHVNDFKKEGKYYVTLDYPGLAEDDQKIFNLQKEQENRRLIYVALTRAVYKCYISLVPREYGIERIPVDSSLLLILKHFNRTMHKDLIEYNNLPKKDFEKISGLYAPEKGTEKKFFPRKAPDRKIKNTFGIHSFSALSSGHKSAPFEKADLLDVDEYDRFIFQELGRGANVGTAVHSIFERLNFSDEPTWDQTILDASKYYSNIIHGKNDEKKLESNIEGFRNLVGHVMNAEINCNGNSLKLSDIQNDKKLPELNFFFSVDKLNKHVIDQYLGEDAKLGGDSDIEGLMTGFMDLVFEHKGKYYILDWKSNHLGNSTDIYDRKSMEEAMILNNYHLQYMIYTVALKRWLEKKIDNFDFDTHFGGVIYVFLRGVRVGSETGIFTKRPDRQIIEDLDVALGGKMQ